MLRCCDVAISKTQIIIPQLLFLILGKLIEAGFGMGVLYIMFLLFKYKLISVNGIRHPCLVYDVLLEERKSQRERFENTSADAFIGKIVDLACPIFDNIGSIKMVDQTSCT